MTSYLDIDELIINVIDPPDSPPAGPLHTDQPSAGRVSEGSPIFCLIPAADLDALPPVEWLVRGEIPAHGLAVINK